MNLREAAQQALAALDEAKNYTNSKAFSPTLTWECEEAIAALKAALSESTVPSDCADSHQPGCDHCNSPLWCGTKCSNCGKVWEWASGIQE